MKRIEDQRGALMAVILLLAVIFSTFITELREEPETIDQPSSGTNGGGIVEIDVDDYFSMRESDDLHIIHIGSPSCSWSTKLEPYLEEISEDYNLTIHYLNIDGITEEEKETFDSSDEMLEEEYGTPTLIIVGQDDIIDLQSGFNEDKNMYIQFFKKNGFIE